ncbi:MAG: SDR family oxidoreductase, partial [Gammaproteobacteria bacterium]
SGWQVFACCRLPSAATVLQNLERNSEGRIKIFCLDVQNIMNIQNLAIEIANSPIDILINNAGIWGPKKADFGSITPLTLKWLGVFQINTIAPLLLAENLINNVAKSKLKIIANMSSNMGSIELNSFGSAYIYRASKAALNAITKSLAIDLRKRDIKVVALHPGWVKTEMGGSDAQISPTESVKGIKNILSRLSSEDSGSFIGYNGEKLAW